MIQLYVLLKHVHVAAVILSGAGFLVRGLWMLTNSEMLSRRWVRVLPHMVDTVLLASAIGLAMLSSQYPLAAGWLTAKVAGLLAYIVLGALALHYAPTRSARVACLVAAVATFAYIVSVALARDPAGFLGLLAGR